MNIIISSIKMSDHICTSNQIQSNCFAHQGACVKTCRNASDSGCVDSGMYGYVMKCPTTPIAHPRTNEGFREGTKRQYWITGLLVVLLIFLLLWKFKRPCGTATVVTFY